ncbi:hypothetical protein F4561_004192 [Lipingzhangella halophila]|uniref:Subtilisin inhibitor domain-containing protein n=1 Tax=Lipingzhangella halophila TaxID=1783352 RepID=A0A7W7W3T2_9ACTN|nr:SSI family serine proteinase inhibitor [Lipingzhangella halophila]MBB4933372.1 hypothetical protein [Lipingzhangella halophila]
MALRASRDSDRGASFVSYAALVMLVSVVAAAVLGTADIPTATATLYHNAVCAVGGDDEDCEGAALPPEYEEEEEQVELVITVSSNAGAPSERWTLTCSPAGGSHPDPEAACAALQAADHTMPEPVSDGELCTRQLGSSTATVSGSIGDTEINEEFDQRGGCEIARWEELGSVLSP